MPLSTIRSLLVEATGRNDLVAPGTALGADFLINAAQRQLDKMLSDSKSAAVYFADINAGDILIPLPKCRTIKKVFLVTSEERVELTKKDIHELRADYADTTSTLTEDEPAYWAACICRPYPGRLDKHEFTNIWALDHIIEYGHENFNSILIMPPPDTDYTLEVWGLFFSDTLVNSNDQSYWTEEHPEILIKAAMYQIEAFYRNTEGQKDLLDAIKVDMDGLLKDIVEQEDINEMEEI